MFEPNEPKISERRRQLLDWKRRWVRNWIWEDTLRLLDAVTGAEREHVEDAAPTAERGRRGRTSR
jgi:hypothetical protein